MSVQQCTTFVMLLLLWRCGAAVASLKQAGVAARSECSPPWQAYPGGALSLLPPTHTPAPATRPPTPRLPRVQDYVMDSDLAFFQPVNPNQASYQVTFQQGSEDRQLCLQQYLPAPPCGGGDVTCGTSSTQLLNYIPWYCGGLRASSLHV